jgi:hypothetical protein
VKSATLIRIAADVGTDFEVVLPPSEDNFACRLILSPDAPAGGENEIYVTVRLEPRQTAREGN